MLSKKIARIKKNQSFWKFVKYGIGEIFLLVIGILIALQVNTWNENRIKKKELKTILNSVVHDLRADLEEVEILIDHYTKKVKTLDTIFNEKGGDDYLTRNVMAAGVNVNYNQIVINHRGYDLLRNFNAQNTLADDSLIVDLIEFYATVNASNEAISSMIKKSVEQTIQLYRDQYQWYEQFITGSIDSSMVHEIYSSTIPRNHILNYSLLVHANYLPFLTNFKVQANKLKDRLEKRLNNF